MSNNSSYKQILKATSIFGGVQIFNIIIQLVRSKIVAYLLGPYGLGVLGLFLSTISIVEKSTNFGLRISAVRAIAVVDSNDTKDTSETIAIIKKLIWITGLLGMTITFIMAPTLSNITFNSSEYTEHFRYLSITLLINQLATGQLIVLQGYRKLKWLAKANIFASFLSLIFIIPAYYFLRLHGIIPAIIISSLITLVVQKFFANKVYLNPSHLSYKASIIRGAKMLKLGFMFSISGLLTVVASYIIRIYIRKDGSMDDVGFYSAGFAIVNTYVGMVFTAMSTDYFPRLSSLNNRIKDRNKLIHDQFEIAILILTPIICFFIINIHWLTLLLYSKDFLPIVEMMQWAILGIFFKTVGWVLAYVILSHGNSKDYMINETISIGYMLLFNVIGYKYLGLKGLGISYMVGYIIYALQILLIVFYKYKLQVKNHLIYIFFICFSLGILAFILSIYSSPSIRYLIGFTIILVSILFSTFKLNKKMKFFQ